METQEKAVETELEQPQEQIETPETETAEPTPEKPKSKLSKKLEEIGKTQRYNKILNIVFPFAFVLIILLVGLTITLVNEAFAYRETESIILSVLSLAVSFAASLFVMSNQEKIKGKTNRYIMPLALGLNSMLLPEIVLNAPAEKSSVLYVILGYALCIILYYIGSVIFQHPKVWYIIVATFFSAYAFLQYYIYEFRGDPISFSDLANLKSATAIKSEYSFTLNVMTIYCILNLAATVFFVIKTKITKSKPKPRLILGGSVVLGSLIMYFVGSYAFTMGIRNRYIVLNFSGSENFSTYSNVGFNLMFYFDGAYNGLKSPSGYSDEKAEGILSQYSTEEADNKPVIIAILNESFADFEHISSFKTNKDYLPNYHKLQSESTSGYVTVSAYGGYTCNSEYEFLSGNTMNFFPSGSAVYTQYLDNKQDSLVSYLNSIGYKTEAVTPCGTTMWDIGKAYENLQFDQSIFNCYNGAPLKEKVNGNVSDRSVYSVVQREVNSNSTTPLFLWVTTMQNHGPYNKKNAVPSEMTFEGYNNSQAIEYLNSIYQSDKALGNLIDHFRDFDREVVIVMFGDHYPHIPEFTEYLYGGSITNLSTEDYSKLHQTPFLIWDNKKTESDKIEDISLNYLSNEVMKKAQIPLAPYQQELEKVREQIPIISGFGYKTSDGKWYTTSESNPTTDDIKNEYNIMQYYRVFGKDD